jgi:hypothetical protein
MPRDHRAERAKKKRAEAPKGMPRPRPEEVGEPLSAPAEGFKSPLGIYLKMNGLSLTSFVRAIGVEYRTAMEWTRGESLPTLPAAFEIEKITKGAVPMEAWLGLPQAKTFLARMRAKQTPDVQRHVSVNPPGGFASPVGNRNGSAKRAVHSRSKKGNQSAGEGDEGE